MGGGWGGDGGFGSNNPPPTVTYLLIKLQGCFLAELLTMDVLMFAFL